MIKFSNLLFLSFVFLKCLFVVNCDENFPNNNDDCPQYKECVPKIQCALHLFNKVDKNIPKPKACKLLDGDEGFCCITGHQGDLEKNGKRVKRNVDSLLFAIENSIIDEAREKFSNSLKQKFPLIDIGRPEYKHHWVFHSKSGNESKVRENSNVAIQQIFANQIYRERRRVSSEDFRAGNLYSDFTQSSLASKCPRPMNCHNIHSRYRTIDGSCNNVEHVMWGSTGQPMERLLPPAYEDGIWMPRIHSHIDGSLLSSPRKISSIVLPDVDRPHNKLNLLLMQFGQFITHDVSRSASITLDNDVPIQCCTEDGSQFLEPRHYACMPIEIEPHDPFYGPFGQRCMNFVRLSLAPDPACRVGYGKQMSKVTHYLDGSGIYGSTRETADALRSFRDGKLLMSTESRLPLSTDPKFCLIVGPENICFKAGDDRANQLISLTCLHTLFAREHNRIAIFLSALHPHYDDEQLYQESRRIVVAQYQHIIYSEYLPLIIGKAAMTKFDLWPRIKSYSKQYSRKINAAITNEFSSSAFRFGHSTVDGHFKIRNHNRGSENIEIPDVMFNSKRLLGTEFYDDMLRTLVQQPMQSFDTSLTRGLTNFLFRGNNRFGLDLGSFNVNRVRDVAVRPYNDYLEAAGLHRIQSFDEFHPEVAKRLAMVYKHPDDIDLWIGGLLEHSVDDALVGPTFVNIIADQFSKFRRGDRYFYDNDPHINPGHFHPHQLEEIRSATLSGIICSNLDYVTTNEMPKRAFISSDVHGNKPKRCDSRAISRINLNAWRH